MREEAPEKSARGAKRKKSRPIGLGKKFAKKKLGGWWEEKGVPLYPREEGGRKSQIFQGGGGGYL